MLECYELLDAIHALAECAEELGCSPVQDELLVAAATLAEFLPPDPREY